MTYIAEDPTRFLGQCVGSGQCVALVQHPHSCATPHTSRWRRGAKVRGNSTIVRGTAIATFSATGQYENRTDGASHAAIYLSQTEKGLLVIDQWKNQPTHHRTINFRVGGKNVNNGNAYYVIIPA